MISMDAYITSSGRYPGFKRDLEQLPDETKKRYMANALKLISKVAELCDRAEHGKVDVTSGFRPASHNKAVGGAEKSCHLSCEAIDIADPLSRLGHWILLNREILDELDLSMESIEVTHKNPKAMWVHLQTRRVPSGNRVFLP